MTAVGSPVRHGLAMRFDVVVDDVRLGSWSTCRGLEVTFKHEPVKELGQHAYTTWIPTRAEYQKVTLQRAMQAGDWTITKRWLESVANDARLGIPAPSATATITLHDAQRGVVASWTLRQAMASAWKGPQLDADSKKVALETLELVHQGFLDD